MMVTREPVRGAASTLPRVTVVVPCYNYGQFLPQAVDSVLTQDQVDVDVIIVDDASTDDSVEVARRLCASDQRVALIEHHINRGHIQTYNDGLRAARGEYLLLLSADDALAPGGLARAVAMMEVHPRVGFVYGPVVVIDAEVPTGPVPEADRWTVWPGREWARSLCRGGRNVVATPAVVVRASVHHEVGYYDTEHPHAGDLQLWLRLAAAADVGYVAGTVQAYYREHGQNMHSSVFGTDAARGMVTDLSHRLEAFTSVEEDFTEGAALIGLARRALATDALDLAARAYVWGLTEQWPVTELVEFAAECDPGIWRTASGRALRRRRRLGVAWSRKNPAFVARELWLRRDGRRADEATARVGLPAT